MINSPRLISPASLTATSTDKQGCRARNYLKDFFFSSSSLFILEEESADASTWDRNRVIAEMEMRARTIREIDGEIEK